MFSQIAMTVLFSFIVAHKTTLEDLSSGCRYTVPNYLYDQQPGTLVVETTKDCRTVEGVQIMVRGRTVKWYFRWSWWLAYVADPATGFRPSIRDAYARRSRFYGDNPVGQIVLDGPGLEAEFISVYDPKVEEVFRFASQQVRLRLAITRSF